MSHHGSKEKIGDPPGATSKFKQQRLPSFYPEHSAFSVSVLLAICAIAFIPIGAVVLNASDSTYRKTIRYDTINRCTITNNQGIRNFTAGADSSSQGCKTQVVFRIDKTVPSPVYIYYRIKGMHQNFRTYYDSRDDSQAADGYTDILLEACRPFAFPGQVNGQSGTADGVRYQDLQYNPAGQIPWSMFNDTINLYTVPAGTVAGSTIPAGSTPICLGGAFNEDGSKNGTNNCEKRNIAMSVDRDKRYVAPRTGGNQWTGVPTTSTNQYRAQGYYAGEPGHRLPLTNDEDYMVWSRPAAFPDFLKLYRQINVDLQPGTYLLDIDEFWDVTRFEGEKHVVIATQSWLGGKHEVLGIAMLTLGCISFVFAVGFILHHILSEGRKSS